MLFLILVTVVLNLAMLLTAAVLLTITPGAWEAILKRKQ